MQMRRRRLCGSLPFEVHPSVLCQSGFVLPGRFQLALGERAHLRGVEAEAPEPLADGARAPLGEREVVLFGAARIAAPDQHHAAPHLLYAGEVGVDRLRRFVGQRRFIEVEIDRLQGAGGLEAGAGDREGLGADAVLAVLAFGAVVVARAGERLAGLVALALATLAAFAALAV